MHALIFAVRGGSLPVERLPDVTHGHPACAHRLGNCRAEHYWDNTDFGVNINTNGDLFGLAWGENIGWINFDTRSLGANRARLDFVERAFFGYAWGENVGWVQLDGVQLFADCNSNDVPDQDDISGGTSYDCNLNTVPDECDLAGGTSQDCQPDGIPDDCQLQGNDCDSNGVPDECQPGDFDGDGTIDVCDEDIDNDTIGNELDACDYTPLGAVPVMDPESFLYGTLRGDCDDDCDVDLIDFGCFQAEFTGPSSRNGMMRAAAGSG